MNAGGPAFPLAASTGDSRDGVYRQNGMTLLDWYAGQAMNGWASGRNSGMEPFDTKPESVARTSYNYASAMLSEKARREATGKDSLQVPDHSPDAGKMARLQAANSELVEALGKVLECIHETRGPSAFFAVTDARAILSKHKGVA